MGVLLPRSLKETITLFGEQITGQTPYGDDIFGDVNLGDWPAAVSPASNNETEIERDTFTNICEFVVESLCPVDGVSSVEWRGDRYEVVGEPKKFYHNAILHHLEFSGRHIKGG